MVVTPAPDGGIDNGHGLRQVARGFPRQLATPAPGWHVNADVVVVGSGVAGLSMALRLRETVDKVVLVTKTVMTSGSTVWAQGGIAAALAETDSPQAHASDTMTAGAGLCRASAVDALATEGPDRVGELIALGAQFDRGAAGGLSLTREGGHHADRIAHAGGDATGREISRALVTALSAVRDDPGIVVMENAMVIDVLTGHRGGKDVACGVTLHVIGEGTRDGVGAVLAPQVVLATGGIGQVYQSSTNPREATGDGTAAALRAGAAVADMEFVQFHPTVLWLGSGARGQQPLVSEAVRGEGAHLVNAHGERFMVGVHPLAELAPRDVVAKEIVRQMASTGQDHVFLDARHLGAQFCRRRFPGIDRRLRSLGLQMGEDLLPVRPAQHYHCGGVVTDTWGRTTLEGLYAVGEVACTGVNGANRLASNSLLEGLVFAKRAADVICEQYRQGAVVAPEVVPRNGLAELLPAATRVVVQQAATEGPGVSRDESGMAAAAKALYELAHHPKVRPSVASLGEWETTNLHQVATVLTAAALARQETRGGHDRSDYPAVDDNNWQVRQAFWVREQGDLVSVQVPLDHHFPFNV